MWLTMLVVAPGEVPPVALILLGVLMIVVGVSVWAGRSRDAD